LGGNTYEKEGSGDRGDEDLHETDP
jgi:hypothetical protein